MGLRAAATYLLAAPATGTPPHSVGGTVLVLRADLRDFALRDYHRWWAFLSETLLPLYVVRPVRPMCRLPGRAEQGLSSRKWIVCSGCASDAGAGSM